VETDKESIDKAKLLADEGGLTTSAETSSSSSTIVRMRQENRAFRDNMYS